MQFGKLDDISHVDWTIPPDDPHNRPFLNERPATEMRVHYGAPAWSRGAWLGKIYPEASAREDWLSHYAKFFNSVELNTSHYRIPGDDVVREWLAQVPPGFLFCPKIYKGISHARNGLLDQRLAGEWQNFLIRLGGKCGPSFLQLPPVF